MKKITALLLALLTLAALCVSCAGPDAPETSTTAAQATTAADKPVETEPPLPELEVKRYDNEEFLILWPEQHPDGHFMHNEISSDDLNGDVIDSAVFSRNAVVEEKYNIDIVSQTVWCSTIPKNVYASFAVGDTCCDAFCAPIGMITSYAVQGMCADFNEMPYYDESHPWWDHSTMEDYAIARARYFGLGDLIVSDNYYPYSIFVNSDMYLNYRFEDDVFELVRTGKWTVDKMMELGRSVPQSLDGVWDYEDTYGLLINSSMSKALIYAFGKSLVENDADGYPQWVFTVDYAQDAIEKIVHVFHDDNIAYDTGDELGHNIPGLSHAQTAVKMFSEGQALFYAEELITAERLKAADSGLSFWLLPMPKYSEDQKEYHCVLNDATVVCVPANQDLEKCSLILSAMSRASVDTLTPAFYYVVLASRYINDPQSAEMLGTILKSAKAPDIATLLKYGEFPAEIATLAQNGSTDFASVYQRRYRSAENSLAQLRKQIDYYTGKAK